MKPCKMMSKLLASLCFVSVGMAQRDIVYNDPSADCVQLVAGEDPRDFVLTLPSNLTNDVDVLTAQLEQNENPNMTIVTMAPTLNPPLPDNILEPCFTVVGEADKTYRLTIRTYDYETRFAMSERSLPGTFTSQGYAWGGTADGIYYCIQGTAQFDFWDEPDTASLINESRPVGSRVTISSEVVEAGKICNSEHIGFNGAVTLPSNPNNVPPVDGYSPPNGTEVFWVDHRYFLKAAHFEYTVAGEDPVTLKGATDYRIYGDPGWESYHSIEIEWYIQGKEKRLYIYVNANDEGIWNIGEVRVYNDQQDWETFMPTDWTMRIGSCFKRDRFVLTNPQGSQIVFDKLALATFRPWSDEMAYLDCIDGMQVVLPEGIDARAAVATLSNVLGAMPAQIDAFSSDSGPVQAFDDAFSSDSGPVQAFVSARDRNELCVFHQRIHGLNSIVQQAQAGASNIEVIASAPYPQACAAVGRVDPAEEVDGAFSILGNHRSMILLVSLLGFLMI